MTTAQMTILLFLISIIASSTSQYWQKRAALYLKSHTDKPLVKKLLAYPLLLSILFLLLATGAWLGVLRSWSVSVAYPMLSLNFIVMLFISHYCFKEPIAWRQWLGSLFILSGVALLGSTL
jgi:undecaprenyl phosphate-alpha-L-ara4N flippase subunit ArnE